MSNWVELWTYVEDFGIPPHWKEEWKLVEDDYFVCSKCDATFITNTSLKFHLGTSHLPTERVS